MAANNTQLKKKNDSYDTDSFEAARARAAQNPQQSTETYSSKWQQSLDDVMNKILNREKFTYDLNGDALYKQYKNQYTTQGQQAMMDTFAKASALTGGYGNSYAQSVGQQTYQGYLQQLNDKVPELYQLALDRYNREGEDLYNQYGLLSDRDNTDYGRYRDKVADKQWQTQFDRGVLESDRAYDRGVFESDRAYDYQVGRDKVADSQWQTQFDRGVLESDRAYDYQVGRDKVADSQWQTQFDRGVFESDRAYDRDVFESDRAYDRDVFASDRAYDYQVRKDAKKKAAADKLINETATIPDNGNDGGDSNGGKITYKDIVDDLNTYIANGADKSEINNYLKEAYNSGVITQSEYNKLKNLFAPIGKTY